jgi:hypothetical protein
MMTHNILATGMEPDERKPVTGKDERIVPNVASELVHASKAKS